MKRHSDIQVDLQLIGKYLSGEASPEEALAIDIWRDESSQNNRMFESVVRLWDGSSEENAYQQPQIIDKWEKLKRGIDEGQQEPASLVNRRSFIGWKIAATFLILLGAAVVFYLLRPHTTPTTYSKVISPEGTIIKDTLKDATIVSLFRDSRLSIQDKFAAVGREVKLDGESYFSVEPLPGQPFIIHTGGIKIIVLSTTFNVKDYYEKVTVSVRSGAVRMQKDTASIVVTAGSTGTFYKTDKRFVLYTDSLNINAYSYATGELYFNNASMKEVKEVLENTYDVKVLFKDKSLTRLRINTRFKKQPLDYVLKVISASLGIQYYVKDDTLYFSKGKTQ